MSSFDVEDIFEEVSSQDRGSSSAKGGMRVSPNYSSGDLFDPEEEPVRPKKKKRKKQWPWLLAIAVVAFFLIVLFNSNDSNNGYEPQNNTGDQLWTSPSETRPFFPSLNFGNDETEPVGTTPTQTVPNQTQPSQTEPVQTTPQYNWEIRYFGKRLSPNYQQIYQYIIENMMTCQEKIPGIHLQKLDDLEEIIHAVHYDYAEIFWFRGGYGSSYYDRKGYIDLTLEPLYEWDKQTCLANKAFIESYTANIISQLSGKSDYEKVKGVYDFLVDNTAYDYAYMGKTPYELFYEKRGVCEGYSRSAQYLLTKLGVETLYICGDAGEPGKMASHAWNIVKIDGQYYLQDVTWGDPYYEDGKQEKVYAYLCVTTEEMRRKHTTNWSDYPECTATAYNYYIVENRYLTSYDEALIKQWMVEDSANRTLDFKVSSLSLFREILQHLEKGDFGTMLRDTIGHNDIYTYSYSDEMYTITVYW